MAASSPAVAASPASSGMISEASEALKKAEAAAKAAIQDALTSANSQTCDDEDVPVVTTTGTQDPPPSKLELCQAKLNALQVNERQWLNPVKDSSSQVADIIVDQAAPGAPSTDAFGR